MLTSLAHALGTLLLTLGSPDPVAPTEPAEGVWPLEPRPEVVAGFDPPAEEWGAGHRGVDLSGSLGQPVLAAHAGSVTYAGRLAGRGVVVVTRGAERTTYEPVDALVEVGDTVTAGQVLGRLELFGSHCWPRACLHWGLLRGERYLDPLTLVGSGPVRLLPLGTGTGAPLAAPALPTAAPGLSLGRVAPWLPGATAGLPSIPAGTPPVTGGPPDAVDTAPPPAAAVRPSPAEQPPLASADALHPRAAELSPLRPAGAPAGRPAAAGPW